MNRSADAVVFGDLLANVPSFAAIGSSRPPSYDFHPLSARFGARYGL